MDINSFISSSIRQSSYDTYFVQFPSFTGYVEAVFYENKQTSLRLGSSEVTPIFQAEKYVDATDSVILVSRILSYIGVRIFPNNNIYDEKIFIVAGGEIFSFGIMGKFYLGFIFIDQDNRWSFYTNLSEEVPFRVFMEDDTFFIENTELGTIIFSHRANFVKANTYSLTNSSRKNTLQNLFYIADELFPSSNDVLTKFLTDYGAQKLGESGILSVDFTSLGEHDFHRCVGFIGMYQSIISEEIPGLQDYKKFSEVNDGLFELPETFLPSSNIGYLDPRWHAMRMGLLEIQYLLFRLEESLRLIGGSIEEIDKLKNVHIIAQRYRLSLNEDEIKKILPKYKKMKELLLNSLKSKLY